MTFALVTGAGGFLGQYLVEQLVAHGFRVRGFGRNEYPALAKLGVEQVRGDIQDAAAVTRACQGVEVVFHTAAVAGLAGPWKHYYGINTQGTHNVIAGCQQQRVRKLVYTSSPSVTFAGRDQCGVNEAAPYPTTWLSYYSQTKALAEQAVLAANDSREFLTCSLRPHLIWGPRDSHLIPRLLERARRGQLRRVGAGKNLVDICYVENAAEAHWQAFAALKPGTDVCGRAYFLSQGEPVNCWDWINQILALAKLPPVQKSLSLGTAYAAGAVLEGVWKMLGRRDDPRMTRFLALQLATSHYFDISRAKTDFGYSPRVSTAEGMRRLAAEISSPSA